MSKRLKIGILGSKGTTFDLIEGLQSAPQADFLVSHVFTLNDVTAARSRVAYLGSNEIRESCERHGIPLTILQSYNFSSAEDLKAVNDADLDLLCVLGWERLLPAAVLSMPREFVCGMHGSPFGLPRGRGRSPMNWSLIMGKSRFTTSLFRYSAGIDDGDIISSRTFEINDHDTIQTLHLKNRIIMQDLVIQACQSIISGRHRVHPQPQTSPSFYPKRTPEDGLIDWTKSATVIHRLIRALAPPYPPAYCSWGAQRVYIEAAQPFDRSLFPENLRPGSIVDVSPSSGSFVVVCGEGTLLVTRFSGPAIGMLRVGDELRGGPPPLTLEELQARYGPDIPEEQWEVGRNWLGIS